MAEFSEVIQQKKRMCNSVLCCKCDIYRLCGEDLSKCPKFINNNPKKAEEVIMKWAAEHPEPVYETWFEYLLRIGVIPENAPAGGEYQWIVESIKHKHISNDIAESLKLHPKEV